MKKSTQKKFRKAVLFTDKGDYKFFIKCIKFRYRFLKRRSLSNITNFGIKEIN